MVIYEYKVSIDGAERADTVKVTEQDIMRQPTVLDYSPAVTAIAEKLGVAPGRLTSCGRVRKEVSHVQPTVAKKATLADLRSAMQTAADALKGMTQFTDAAFENCFHTTKNEALLHIAKTLVERAS